MGFNDQLSSADVALRVQSLRQRQAALLQQEQQLVGQVSLLRTEARQTLDREGALHQAVQVARAAVDDTLLGVSASSTSIGVLAALRRLLDEQAGNDADTVANLEETLKSLSAEAAQNASTRRGQRAETLKVIKKLSRQWEVVEAEARRSDAELLRLLNERVELEARTDAAAVKHAKELFDVPD